MNPPQSVIPSATVIASRLDKLRNRAERRVAHRVPCRVRVGRESGDSGFSVIGQTVNLSASGLAVQLGQPIDLGTDVEVFLPHLDGEPTRLLGHVAHTRRVHSGAFEIGIRMES